MLGTSPLPTLSYLSILDADRVVLMSFQFQETCPVSHAKFSKAVQLGFDSKTPGSQLLEDSLTPTQQHILEF